MASDTMAVSMTVTVPVTTVPTIVLGHGAGSEGENEELKNGARLWHRVESHFRTAHDTRLTINKKL